GRDADPHAARDMNPPAHVDAAAQLEEQPSQAAYVRTASPGQRTGKTPWLATSSSNSWRAAITLACSIPSDPWRSSTRPPRWNAMIVVEHGRCHGYIARAACSSWWPISTASG